MPKNKLPKISEVDAAIVHFCSAPVITAMREGGSLNRVGALNQACLLAFVKLKKSKEDKRQAKILRKAYRALAKHGFFPNEMWDVPCMPQKEEA